MRYGRYVCVVVLAGLLNTGRRDSLPTMPTGSFLVSGRVLDFASGGPVPGVAIQFDDQQLAADATGGYTVTTTVRMHVVNAADASVTIWVHGPMTRGDVFINIGPTCAARYGQVFDSQTGWPIENTTVDGFRAGADGWYRRDGGCAGC